MRYQFTSTRIVVQSLSHVQLFATPWTAPHQASISFTISQSLLKLTSFESVMPSNHLILCPSFPALSPSASVLSMNIQDWFPLGLTGLTTLLSKGLSRIFSTIVQKYQFFSTQSYIWSNTHIRTWLLEKPYLWLYGPLLAKWCLCFLIHCLGWS